MAIIIPDSLLLSSAGSQGKLCLPSGLTSWGKEQDSAILSSGMDSAMSSSDDDRSESDEEDEMVEEEHSEIANGNN